MKESEIIKRIESKLGNNFIGDDCAYLKELGIVITQDSLVENVHFKREWYSPFDLGYKSVAVNISDVLASGAIPKYVTIALSLPKEINSDFIDKFYEGAKSALFGAEIAGGDITGSMQDIMISITAIGSDKGRKISSRKNAKEGYVVITSGEYGNSARGLRELINGFKVSPYIHSHLKPNPDINFSSYIGENINVEYAMMDSSDGLADALFKIAESSGVKIVIDYSKIPHKSELTEDEVLFGGEDYNLVAAVPYEIAINVPNAVIIGQVESFDGTRLDISGKRYTNYNELNLFDHFK